jgi:hypothetical protein
MFHPGKHWNTLENIPYMFHDFPMFSYSCDIFIDLGVTHMNTTLVYRIFGWSKPRSPCQMWKPNGVLMGIFFRYFAGSLL